MTGRRQAGLLSLLGAIGALFGSAPASAQEAAARITGLIRDAESQRPLAGVQVYIEGTSLGSLTTSEGRFVLQNVRPGRYTVVAQIIGHTTGRKEVSVAAGQAVTADFDLTTTVLSLQEVVVTGVTDPIAGAKLPFTVAKVSKENVATVPTTNSALAAIQGKVAGASIVRGSGQPGSGVSILLRTPTSIQGSNSPMLVVDGVILAETIGGTSVDLESLDIESVEVVKGAAAASLYGSRAASGVIQITTSRGRNLNLDQTRITVRSEYGATTTPKDIPLSKSHNYLQNAQGQWVDADGNVVARTLRVLDPDGFMDNPYTNKTYDNLHTYFRSGQFLTNTVNLTHSSASTNFLTSFNMYDERGSLETSDGFKRMNFRVNLDHRLRDNFSFSVSGYHNRYNQDLTINASGNGLFWDLLLFPADVNIGQKDANGVFVFQPDTLVLISNPLFAEQMYDEDEKRARTLGNIDVRWNPFQFMNLQGSFSYDRSDENYIYYEPKGLPESLTAEEPTDGVLQMRSTNADVMNAAVRANFMRNFGRLNARSTVSATMEREEFNSSTATGSDFFVVDVPDLNVAATRSISSSKEEIRSTGYLAQTGLDFDGRYIADVLIRRDGSSLFGPDARWQTYYRAAGAWRMGAESWWPWQDRLNEFKLRYAMGTAGTRPGFAYQYETWSVSSSGAVSKTTLGNRNLRPGHSTEQEFGIDLIALNKYQLELTYARQVSKDQIIQLPQPAISGYPNQWFNTGEQTGETYEATFQAQLVNRPNLSWSTTVVADRSRSRITQWDRACFFGTLTNFCQNSALSDMWGERFLRGKQDLPSWFQGNADEFDVNDDGYLVWVGAGNTYRSGMWGTSGNVNGRAVQWGIPIIDTDSTGARIQQKVGSSAPDFSIGWLNNLTYRGFAVHTHLHAQIGGQVYNASRQRMYQHERHGDLDQAGKAQENKKPIAYYQGLYNQANITSHFVEDGAFLKLRALSVQYRLTGQQLERVGIRNMVNGLSLGVIGRNLFTLTNYSGFDPEVGSVLTRYDSFDYPNTRTLTLTAEVTF